MSGRCWRDNHPARHPIGHPQERQDGSSAALFEKQQSARSGRLSLSLARLNYGVESPARGEKRRRIGALTLLSDFDHNLSKCSLREMLVSFSCFLERIYLVDHGTNLVFVEERIHPVER